MPNCNKELVIHPISRINPEDVWYKRCYQGVFKRDQYELKQPYTVYCPYLGTNVFINSPFIFDGASIPIGARAFISPNGILFAAALLHDFIYRHGYIQLADGTKKYLTRRQADDLFYEQAKYCNNVYVIPFITHKAVRAFGWLAYRKNNKEKI